MGGPSFAKWAVGALGAASLLSAVSAPAEEIRIVGSDCASGVHLVAREAHLSEILKRLSQALDFQLSFESDSDPVVSIDAIRQPPDLVTRLASLENVSITQASNRRCPGRQRIVKVWVLPTGAGSQLRQATAPADPGQARQTAEQARRAKDGMEMILRAHGVPTESN